MKSQLSLNGKVCTVKSVEKPVKKPVVKPMQIQDSFLKGAIGKVITIYTVAGESVTGALEFFDKFVLLVEFTDKMKSLVYKSGVTRMDIEE